MDTRDIHDLLSGRRRGVGAGLLRAGLWAASGPYALGAAWRNRRFDRRRQVHQVDVPVISVGNITTGGTGKTPMVEWTARWFRSQGARVTLVSRGYGAEEGARNDEALELERRLPDVPHLQNPDRVAAAETAIEELEAQVIVLDDGFQHRRLHRDLDLVLLDALAPFGYGHVLPRGLLREPLRGLRRADLLVLSRADAVDEQRREEIRRQATRYAGDKPWAEVAHAPRKLLSTGLLEQELPWLSGRRVAAFCGIGNPQGFQHTLEQCGCEVTELRTFPDHHDYTRDDIKGLTQWASATNADAVICTEKDFVKIQLAQLGDTPLWALQIGLQVLRGEDALLEQLERIDWQQES